MSLTKTPGALQTPEVLCLWIHGPIFRSRCLSGVYTDRSLALHHMNETVHNDSQIYQVTLETRTANMPGEPVSELRRFDLTAQRNNGDPCPCDKCTDERAGRSTNYAGGPMKTDGRPALAVSAAAVRQIDLEDMDELPTSDLRDQPGGSCIACGADLDENGDCPACYEREEAEIEAAARGSEPVFASAAIGALSNDDDGWD